MKKYKNIFLLLIVVFTFTLFSFSVSAQTLTSTPTLTPTMSLTNTPTPTSAVTDEISIAVIPTLPVSGKISLFVFLTPLFIIILGLLL